MVEEPIEAGDREVEMGAAIAEVAAEGDGGGDHASATRSIARAGRRPSPSPSDARPAAEQIGAAGKRLLEEPLLLARFAEDDAKHPAMAGVGHRLHAGPPAIQERLSVLTIGLEDLPGVSAPLP